MECLESKLSLLKEKLCCFWGEKTVPEFKLYTVENVRVTVEKSDMWSFYVCYTCVKFRHICTLYNLCRTIYTGFLTYIETLLARWADPALTKLQ
jgi:hypothetical protein